MGLGLILGPGLGGLLGGESVSMPFFVAGGLCAVALVLISVFLPESLTEAAQTHAEWLQANYDKIETYRANFEQELTNSSQGRVISQGKGEVIYKILAYRKAADSLNELGRDVSDIWQEGGLQGLQAIPGVGSKRAARIVRNRPYGDASELEAALDDPDVAATLLDLAPM